MKIKARKLRKILRRLIKDERSWINDILTNHSCDPIRLARISFLRKILSKKRFGYVIIPNDDKSKGLLEGLITPEEDDGMDMEAKSIVAYVILDLFLLFVSYLSLILKPFKDSKLIIVILTIIWTFFTVLFLVFYFQEAIRVRKNKKI